MTSPVTVVVGVGGGGIGSTVAHKFASANHRIAVIGRTEDKLQTAVAELSLEFPAGGVNEHFRYYICDSGVSEQVKSAVEKIIADFGRIDNLIYNAGMGFVKPLGETTEEDFMGALSSNALGVFLFVKNVYPIMLKQEKISENGTLGVIGVSGATASWRGMPVTAGFAPAKFATRGLCQALARSLGPQGIHVFHGVIDGVVATQRMKNAMPDKPVNEMIDPKAVAESYYFYATQPPSTWTTEFNVAPAAVMEGMVTI